MVCAQNPLSMLLVGSSALDRHSALIAFGFYDRDSLKSFKGYLRTNQTDLLVNLRCQKV